MLVICISFVVMAAVFLPILLISMLEDRRLRKRMAERRRHNEELLRQINENAERGRQARLVQEVQRQAADHPAVTLPVTHCERRSRRRFLPLEVRNESK